MSFVVIDDSEVADEVELMKLFKGFGEAYGLKILYPSTAFISVNEFVEALFDKTFQYP
ncbi:MAG: hypothetical protein U9O85_01915 [Euryarchaeota archaeon]|nr:hypothetical protein [Euryarchaeota archaeon]